MEDFFQAPVEKVKLEPEADISEFYYEEDTTFSRPVIMRGSRKQFIPNPNIKKMRVLDEESTVEVMSSLKKTENFKHLYLSSIEDLNLIEVQEQGFLFHVVQEGKNIPLFIPFDIKQSGAFKRLSSLLEIPYSYCKKNPSNLNHTNFDFWKSKIVEAKQNQIPVCVVYSQEPLFDLQGEHPSAHLVMTLFRTKCSKSQETSSGIMREIQTTIPVLHKMFPLITELVKEKLPEAKLILHSCELGFIPKKKSKGDHFLKFIVDDPNLKFKVKKGEIEEEYLPTISLRSNFTGEAKDFGYVDVSIQLLRLVCQNGIMVQIPQQYLQSIQERFVQNLAKVNNLDLTSKTYSKKIQAYKQKFNKVFSGNACKTSLPEFMSSFNKSTFADILSSFLLANSEGAILGDFNELTLPIPIDTISDLDFVDAVESLSKSHKIPSQIVKALILEFLANKKDGILTFKDAYSLVQYISFLAQSFNARVQQEIEQNVIKFGLAITSALVHKINYKKSLLSKYQNMLE